MWCHDTGSMEAIRIPKETIELAQEMESALQTIRTNGQGDGTITVKVTGGKIGFLDFTIRRFFGKNKKTSAG